MVAHTRRLANWLQTYQSFAMTQFSLQMTRCPIAHDAEAASNAAAFFADMPPLLRELVSATAGCSPYLTELLRKEADWVRSALEANPDDVISGVLDGLEKLDRDALGPALRQAKRRIALYVALADLAGVWPLEKVTGALTLLADKAVTCAISVLVADEIQRGNLPGARADDAVSGAGMVALAMGKMGAGELNYSSDIDLICLFDETRYTGVEVDARVAFVRVARRMTAMLSDITDEGYVFRTDLRLRPDASVTPVCISMVAAESYYESMGRTWERAAFIKARPCGGDLNAGAAFLKTLAPFVWRKHLDFAAIQDAHDMRLRIRSHRGLRGIAIEGHDLKLGLGGIREIEFFTQTRQLIAGGRDASLRDRTTVGGLARLAERDWVPQDVAYTLTQHYRDHRELEHRLQMVGDTQTHTIPTTPHDVARIASFLGQPEDTFRRVLLARLQEVDTLTEGFFAPASTSVEMPILSDSAKAIVNGWMSYPALRSERAQASFRRLRPALLQRLSETANIDEALIALDGFLAGLPTGVQLFALFEANPSLIDLIIDIAATAPELARYLSRHARVLDAVIGGSFFADWPGKAGLGTAATRIISDASEYEAKLVALRVWQKEWHFRIGVHYLRGLLDADEAALQYADLADATLVTVFPVVVAEFARKHGPMPGRGAVLLGMGSLGAGMLNAASDLDLIVIYDAMNEEMSDGPKPLPTRPYYARLTQALVTAITASMAEGRLYEVDMRLRPSGRQGPVATSWQSFCNYQETEAWTWEHLALTRARVIAGDADLSRDLETFRRRLIVEKGKGARVRHDVVAMRARLADAHSLVDQYEGKHGPGRLLDIDLAAQTLALMSGSAERSTAAQLRDAAQRGTLSSDLADELCGAQALFWKVQAGLRLLSALPEKLGEGAKGFMLHQTGYDTAAHLSDALGTAAERAATIIDALIGEKETRDADG